MALFGIPKISGLLSGVKAGVTGTFGTAQKAGAYQKYLVNTDFIGIATADVSLSMANTSSKDNYTLLGYYIVPAQQEVNIGYGVEAEQGNQGRLYIQLYCSVGAEINGIIKLIIKDANETFATVVFEMRTSILSIDETDMTKVVYLPEETIRTAKEDDRIELWFGVDYDAVNTTGEVDYNDVNTKIRIPITVYAVPR